MINRSLLRIKSVQILYSYFVSDCGDAERTDEELGESISRASDLYYCVLQFLVEARRYAERAAEHIKCLEEPENDPLYGLLQSNRISNNRVARMLEENAELREYLENRDLSWVWEIHRNAVRDVLMNVQNEEYFKRYVDGEDSFESDIVFCRHLLQKSLIGNEEFEQAIEEVNIYWNDDLFNAVAFAVKTLKHFNGQDGENYKLMPVMKGIDEIEYARRLVRYTIANNKKIDEKIEPLLKGWNIERLSVMDLTVVRAAVAEMLVFDDIHVAVTMNEYIEIAKAYCGGNSVQFVSGLLYSIGKELAPLEMKSRK